MKITKPFQYSEKVNGKEVLTFYGNSVDEIVSDVMRIRERNGASVPEWNSLYNSIQPKIRETKQVDGVESKKFKQMTSTASRHSSKRSRSVSLRDAARAASALMKIIPGQYVSKPEYDRRVNICASCDLRNQSSDCMGCGGAGLATRMLMNVRSRLKIGYQLNDKIGKEFCGFCGCSLSLLLVTLVKNYKQEEEDINNKRPSHCWLRKGSNNYVGEIS